MTQRPQLVPLTQTGTITANGNGKHTIAPRANGAIRAAAPPGYHYLEPLPGHSTWDQRLTHHCFWRPDGRLEVREHVYGIRTVRW